MAHLSDSSHWPNCYDKAKNNCQPFACTSWTTTTFCDALDRPPLANDVCECCNVRGQPACADCMLVFTPFAFVIDLVSLPVRSCYRCYGKASNCRHQPSSKQSKFGLEIIKPHHILQLFRHNPAE